MRRRTWLPGLAALALGLVAAAPAARADGYPPFFGYSAYFGGPAPYFTPDTDVQQTTLHREDSAGFGTRTYHRGGPFWGYRPARVRASHAAPRPYRARRNATLRSKG